jgi:hypothetical protein
MRTLSAVACRKRSFGLNETLRPLHNPSSDVQVLSRYNMAPEPDPQRSGKRFAIHGGDRLGHRFIEHGADDSSVYDAAESLPIGRWTPVCGDRPVRAAAVADAQTPSVVLAANHAGALGLRTELRRHVTGDWPRN